MHSAHIHSCPRCTPPPCPEEHSRGGCFAGAAQGGCEPRDPEAPHTVPLENNKLLDLSKIHSNIHKTNAWERKLVQHCRSLQSHSCQKLLDTLTRGSYSQVRNLSTTAASQQLCRSIQIPLLWRRAGTPVRGQDSLLHGGRGI